MAIKQLLFMTMQMVGLLKEALIHVGMNRWPKFYPRIFGIIYRNANPAVYMLSILNSRSNMKKQAVKDSVSLTKRKCLVVGHLFYL
jgi:hypothetical protein